MNRRLPVALLAVPLMVTTTSAPSFPAQTSEILQLDPKLATLVSPDAVVTKIAGDFGFVEGPVWVPREGGYLLFSDIPNNRVHRLDRNGVITTFIEQVTPPESPAGGMGGSNGLMLDTQGRLVLCEHGNRRVARLQEDGSRRSLVERYQGKRLNSPNDIIFDRGGGAYFTDPSYGLPNQTEGKQLEWNGIYRITFDESDEVDETMLLDKTMSNPNGIGLSPDEKTLYVANSSVTQKSWMKFSIRADGGLEPGEILFDAKSISAPGVPDGLAVDERGNLWASGPGGILVIDPKGRHLGTISLPELPANAGFGGEDGKTLYITARTGLYSVELKVRGQVFVARED